MCPDLRAQSCFLRCCQRGLVFVVVVVFGADGTTTIKSSITGKEKQPKTPRISGQSSRFIDRCHPEQQTIKQCRRTVHQIETKIATKIVLIYSARTTVVVLVAKMEQRDRLTNRTDRHLSANA